VKPVLEAVARTMTKLHRERGLAIGVRAGDEARFHGEQQDLEEMVGNLVDNACKWANANVELELVADRGTGARSRGYFRVVVDDDGPGLAPDAREAVLARGRRLDESKPGSGLGLSIVVDLAGLYGGRLELGSAPLGGLRAELVLPMAEA
jgi:signal transduction histidine kinase